MIKIRNYKYCKHCKKLFFKRDYEKWYINKNTQVKKLTDIIWDKVSYCPKCQNVTKICPVCGIEFHFKRGLRKQGKKYCSQKCAMIALKEYNKLHQHLYIIPNPKPRKDETLETKICPICGIEFHRRRESNGRLEARWKHRKTCGRTCGFILTKRTREEKRKERIYKS